MGEFSSHVDSRSNVGEQVQANSGFWFANLPAKMLPSLPDPPALTQKRTEERRERSLFLPLFCKMLSWEKRSSTW